MVSPPLRMPIANQTVPTPGTASPRLVALDMDGTLTQHKSPLSDENERALRELQRSFRLVMVGAGSCERIHHQLGGYPMDLIGCYGMEMARWDCAASRLEVVDRSPVPAPDDAARAEVLRRVDEIRNRHGFTDYAGESVEFHASGMLTFALLGTAADLDDKLAFDPDRSRRREFYPEVCEAFSDFTVFVGGSSSFDIVPRPFDKLHALKRYCDANGISPDDAVYVGDDYGPGGNDEQVYTSDVEFITIDDYRTFPEVAARLLARVR